MKLKSLIFLILYISFTNYVFCQSKLTDTIVGHWLIKDITGKEGFMVIKRDNKMIISMAEMGTYNANYVIDTTKDPFWFDIAIVNFKDNKTVSLQCLLKIISKNVLKFQFFSNGFRANDFKKTRDENTILLKRKKDDLKSVDSLKSAFGKNEFMTNCVKHFTANTKDDEIWTTEMGKIYCNCAYEKLSEKKYTHKELEEIKNVNSAIYNEIGVPCFQQAMNLKSQSITTKRNDIVGNKSQSAIPLIDYFGKGYKIKIGINGIIKYYLFDTGASDLIIDTDTERELLLNGTLKRENYLDSKYYTLANNQQVKAQLVKVDNIKIGDYTNNNVTVGVINDGLLLCGKDFLAKFSKWELDTVNKLLIIYK